MSKKLTGLKIAFFLATIFFIAGFITLKDYGVSWDEAVHFSRGQIYLNYFLTGEKEYNQQPTRKSFYQFEQHTGEYFFKDNVGHPPVNGILATISNYIFYQKLGILSDIDSYHLFNILVSSILVFITVAFMLRTFGTFPAVISFLALSTYPLFWSESHFNIKDPALSAFFAGTIWTFYESFTRRSCKWLIACFVFLFLALGTKFNILFLPLIIIPWMVLVFRQRNLGIKKYIRSFSKKYLLVLLVGPIFVILALTASWPYLWENWPKGFLGVLNYYKQIGTSFSYQPGSFYFLGFNTFPIQWVLFTTPPLVLLLSFLGIVSAWIHKNKFNKVSILWLLWLIVPIVRVSVPGAVIYGGVRQIMEFIPALAILAGLGAWQISKWLKVAPVKLLLTLAFIWPVFILVKLHPNENVYFNSFIGGLSGAKERNFPSWGNSYGNTYFSGIKWLNKNAEQNAKVSLIQGIAPNAPQILFRSDIGIHNYYLSGIRREGEYLMELIFNDTGKAFYYAWDYVNNFLDPIYEEKIDGVTILKIWKNDLEHTKPEFRLNEKLLEKAFSVQKDNNALIIDLGNEYLLSRVILNFIQRSDCEEIGTSFVDTSFDKVNWGREKDWIPFPQMDNKNNLEGDTINFYFAGEKARYIRFWFDSPTSCGLNNPEVQVMTLD
ncbi:ArnT family glycosyltransferase [Patescibacteria group bacterium]